ncbi:MATE efflux family protein 2, chloroplastic [Morella rubra]|uniref:Protein DETOXIFICATION n=1 Tax=Morella rubra TaxID=262757 RepID=A0A6A1WGT1_9ROSI|nr:MATE efflux family protein 2, chloroplastic [Morella rubra]
MATGLSRHQLFCVHSPKSNCSPYKSQTRNPNFSVRLRTVPKSSTRKHTGVSLESESPGPQEPKSATGCDHVDPNLPSSSSPSHSLSSLAQSFRNGLKVDELGVEILTIALPAALALAADPVMSLVDTAFVGHLGSVELAAVGVSVSVFNLVSKLFNVPLLNITTSFVAEEQALVSKAAEDSSQIGSDGMGEHKGKKLLPSVSTSLALAASIGIAEAVALFFGSGFLMNIMGIPVESPMRVPAEHFLTLRAFGAPPIVIALAAQGTFRGFMDTKTPLYAIGKLHHVSPHLSLGPLPLICAGNLLNALLDPILIFTFDLGIGGAAVATVISEYIIPCRLLTRYLIAFILLWKLSGKILLIAPNNDGGRLARYLKSGGLLIGRTLAVLVTMTLATSMAAREGPIPMAGHQICVQVWLAVSLLTDALALAGQALLASGYTQGNYEQARQVICRVLQIGLVTGIVLAVVLFVGFGAFSSLFSTDLEVLTIAWSGILFVAGSQPMNALAFVLDGLYYGVSDFGYAAYSMVLVGLISSIFLLLAAPAFGLAGVWMGLFLFMTLRVVAGIWRGIGRLGIHMSIAPINVSSNLESNLHFVHDFSESLSIFVGLKKWTMEDGLV